ncbi:outer membrane beta-barrel protein [Saccharicrinis aurantiacus]|uniref:outer membrane beta-barrel protein n=1 Tax=Saccharicrinis aurantiacus TaxID=1849719 RepID=UPI00249132A3|nr:outer membrane beta-barrel protein [Saccharicrinis aurantiacus]
MKNAVIILLLSVISLSSYAQTQKGKYYVGGSSDLSFVSQKMDYKYDGDSMLDEKVSTSSFKISPSVGYFAADNFLIKLSMDYEISKVEDEKTSTFIIGPEATYYLSDSNIKPYLSAAIGWGNTQQDDLSVPATAYTLGGGVAFFLSEYASLDLGLGYVNSTLTDPNDTKAKFTTSGFAMNVGFSLYF